MKKGIIENDIELLKRSKRNQIVILHTILKRALREKIQLHLPLTAHVASLPSIILALSEIKAGTNGKQNGRSVLCW